MRASSAVGSWSHSRGYLAVVILVGAVLAGWLLVPDGIAQGGGVVFPNGAVYGDSNPVTVPIVEDPSGSSADPGKAAISDWNQYDR